MKGMRALPAFLAWLAVSAAWMGCTGTEEDGRPWAGNIRNTCGPADGPALYALFGEAMDSTCAPIMMPRSGHGIYVDGIRVDSLKPGMVIKDTISDCIDFNCAPKGTASIKVLQVGPNRISGTYEVRLGRGDSAAVQSGPVELKVCPQEHMCG